MVNQMNIKNVLYKNCIRYTNTTTSAPASLASASIPANLFSSATLLVSSPHPKSNIRLIKYTNISFSKEHVWVRFPFPSLNVAEVPKTYNLTLKEREFRKLDVETQEWVHSFFKENNRHFQASKENFIQHC